MIYKIRVILDSQDDIFRDIEIKANQTLGKLHEAIKSAFSLQGDEMASFYYSDSQWEQGEEIPLEDMTDDGSGETMYDLYVKEALKNEKDRLLYVYDFLNMWTFYVEVLEIIDKKPTLNYPLTVFRFGKMPLKVPSKKANNIDTLMSMDEDEEDDDPLFDPEMLDDDIMDGYEGELDD